MANDMYLLGRFEQVPACQLEALHPEMNTRPLIALIAALDRSRHRPLVFL